MKLSIITITYNNLEGLKRTTMSIKQQTWKDYEWIVIDGGSTDGTKDYLESLVPQPDFWVCEKDNGVYNAQNKGIAKATGEYTICMNAGDKFHSPSTLEQVFSHEITADIVYGNWQRIYSDERTEMRQAPQKISPLFFYYSNICHQAMFIKRHVMQENPFNEEYKIYADWSKWRDLHYKGYSFEYIPVCVCDFEADCGLSERESERQRIEYKQLWDESPKEITDDIAALRKEDREHIAKLRIEIDNEIREKIHLISLNEKNEKMLWKSQEDYHRLEKEYLALQEVNSSLQEANAKMLQVYSNSTIQCIYRVLTLLKKIKIHLR